ncbi:putative inactive receptor kinase [Iris pallida]|uniref:Inactive receptor kinase n=1 Tax=Iris pallida TaxID=29817 RepID=A0AAX6F7C7_IRIPA|nr:putative inactive receptor kinase [Iris pallida]
MGSGHRPVIFLTLLLLLSAASSDLDADRAALLSLRAAVARSLLPTWTPSASPCSYQGVVCEGGRVSSLRLPGAGLLGSIPAGTLGNLTALRILSLRFNALSGPLPADLLSLPELRNLYLQQNRLSGGVPDAISGLKNLVRLNLAGNSFTGNITAGFSALPRLRTLFLERNSFSGALPDLDLPNLDQFNVSFNRLNGSVPPSLRKMPAAAFLGMSVCGGPLPACPGDLSPSPSPSPSPGSAQPPGGDNGGGSGGNKSHKKKKLSSGAIAGISVACAVALGMVVLAFVLLCTKRSSENTAASAARTPAARKPQARAAVVSAAAGAAPPPPAGSAKKLVFFGEGGKGEFDLEDLLRASAEVLGKGTFGTAYKAVLETGVVVAVKRLKDVTLGEREFREKVERVGAMNHPNLVPLKAYYFSKDEKLMVYEYMPLGSLSALLHGNRGSGSAPLNWEIRSAIALGAARGLAYIHSTGLSSSHGNIKSSNILLGKSNMDARVSDHGLAQLAESSSSSMPARAAGYRAPEVTDPRRVSQKADVYSFGVLLLELLTGKAPAQAVLNEEGTDLPRWVQSVVREEWASEVFDAELLRDQNVEEEMVQLLQLAVDCAAEYPDSRPSMAEVVGKIEDIRQSSLRVAAADGGENESRRTDSIDGSKPDGGDH